jgi:D-alanyl-D-alanine carboxypeptidase/D-alanyl-D-alanine-endopeptidase (penicillin-binding protein 4)
MGYHSMPGRNPRANLIDFIRAGANHVELALRRAHLAFKASSDLPMRTLLFLLLIFTFALCTQAQPDSLAAPPSSPAPGDTSYAELGQRLQNMVAQMDWGKGQVSFAVGDAGLPIEVLSVDADKLVVPGATIQILLAAAALETLSPGYRFATELRVMGKPEKGKLNGPLVVRGGGDPTLSQRYCDSRNDVWNTFDDWAKALKKQGIHTVRQGIVADARLFDDQWMAPGWPEELRGTAGLPSIGALNFNHNCLEIEWISGRTPGALAQYLVFPFIEKYTYFSSTVRIAKSLQPIRIYSRVPQGNLISASGELPAKTSLREFAAIEDPGRFFVEALKMRLVQKGITIEGEATSTARPTTGNLDQTDTVAVRFSPPLRDILKKALAKDSTLESEVIFKMLGVRASAGRDRGSFVNGAEALDDWLDQHRHGTYLRMLADGSGRSPLNRLCAGEFINIMRSMQRSDLRDDFAAVLPQAGTGLLEGRMQDDRAPRVVKRHWWSRSRTEARPPLPIWALASEAAGEAPDQHRAALVGRARAANGHMLVFAFLVGESKSTTAALRGQLEQLAITLTR